MTIQFTTPIETLKALAEETDNYTPIYRFIETFPCEVPLELVHQTLLNLCEEDKISLSAVNEVANLTKKQLDSGIKMGETGCEGIPKNYLYIILED